MSSKSRFHLSPVVAATLSCFLPVMAMANPMGATVVSGQATFDQSGSLLSITNSPGAILNWNQFSIAAGETTRFNQINAQSAVLNRVTGQDPSQILGRLESNGRVFLINPNGILFGQGSVVDVAGLIASSLNMSDADFLAGKLRFQGANAAAVSNLGQIKTPDGGLVMLVAPTVSNEGIIENRNGEIYLAAGQSVELVDTSNTALRVKVEAGGEALNLGQIIASSGKAGIFAATLTQSGKVSANRAEFGPNGEIVFKATGALTLAAGSTTQADGGSVLADSSADKLTVAGRVDVSSTAGQAGKIELTGQHVEAATTAELLANGLQGGQVLLGGDFQGKNTAVHNASTTYLARGAHIAADGSAGAGGKVVVWADERTAAYGSISAQGKTQGGFAEVSGKQGLAFGADVNLTGENGDGTLLLDPMSITIDASGSTAPLDPSSLIGSTSDVLTIAASVLENISGNLVLQATSSVTVNDALTLTGNHSKSISITTGDGTTAGLININADIVTDHSGGISLTAQKGAANGSTIQLAGALQSTGGGAIKLEATTVTLGVVEAPVGSIDAGVGDVIIGSPGSTNSIVSDITMGFGSTSFIKGRSVYLEADNGLDISSGANVKATGDLYIVAGNGKGLTMSNGGYLEAARVNLAVDKLELTTQSPSEKLIKATEHLSLTGGRGELWNPGSPPIAVTLGGTDADSTSMMVISVTDLAAIDTNNIRIGLVDAGAPITGQYVNISLGGDVDLSGKLLALAGTGGFAGNGYSLTANGIAANFGGGLDTTGNTNNGLLKASNLSLVSGGNVSIYTDADHLSVRAINPTTINIHELNDVQSVALGMETGGDAMITFNGAGNVGSFFAGYKTGTGNIYVTAAGNLGVYGTANGAYVSLTSTNGQISNAGVPTAMAALLNGGTFSPSGLQASSLTLSAAQSITGLDVATSQINSATSTNGSVGLNASGDLTISGSISAAGDVGVVTRGGLLTNSITAGSGRSVVLLSGGDLYQYSGSTVQSTNGSIKLGAIGNIGLALLDAGSTGKVELISGGKIGVSSVPAPQTSMPSLLPAPQQAVTLAPNVIAGELYAVAPVSINLAATVPSDKIRAFSASGQVTDASGNVIAVPSTGQFASDIQGNGFSDISNVSDKVDEDGLNRERKTQEQRKREEEERLGKRKKAKKC